MGEFGGGKEKEHDAIVISKHESNKKDTKFIYSLFRKPHRYLWMELFKGTHFITSPGELRIHRADLPNNLILSNEAHKDIS